MSIKKKFGFTLAETLVALAIIGVLASIIIPSIVNSYNKVVLQVKLKKMYAVLSHISQYAIADYGEMSYTDFYDGSSVKVQEWFSNYMKPYLKIDKVCYDEEGCWAKNVTHLNGDSVSNLNARGIGGNIVTFRTMDGTLFNADGNVPADLDNLFGIDSDVDALVLHIDLNGFKKPNVIGKDIYVFVYTNKGFVPAGNDRDKEFVEQECSEDGTGIMCASKIARNSWELGEENL